MNDIEHLFINLALDQELNFINYFSHFKKEFSKLKNDYHLAVKTIYIATNDSIFLTNKQLREFLTLINSIIGSDLIEYSFEIGYQTLKNEQLELLKRFKINRLIWKIRTFNNNLLKGVNQTFNANEILSLINTSLELGFNNFSCDFEDNLKSQTERDIINDLNIAWSLNAPHISYQSHNDVHNLNNKKLINNFLSKYHYNNYEFFSFALSNNYYSQQTLAYLQLKNWYGLGPNAGSFFIIKDKIMTINNTNEINWKKIKQTLNQNQYYQLLIIQGLMLKTGLVLENDNLLAFNSFSKILNKLIKANKLIIENNALQATNQGWNLLNDILLAIINV